MAHPSGAAGEGHLDVRQMKAVEIHVDDVVDDPCGGNAAAQELAMDRQRIDPPPTAGSEILIGRRRATMW